MHGGPISLRQRIERIAWLDGVDNRRCRRRDGYGGAQRAPRHNQKRLSHVNQGIGQPISRHESGDRRVVHFGNGIEGITGENDVDGDGRLRRWRGRRHG